MTGKRVVRQGLRSRLLDRVRNNPGGTWILSLSKRKVMVIFERGKQSMVLRETDPLVARIQEILDTYHEKIRAAREASLAIKKEAAHKARRLLHEIVREHACLSVVKDEVIVESANGSRFVISIKSGTTYRLRNNKRRFVCVTIPYYDPNGYLLPLADRIIAIALTIAYAPRLICTL